jgi:hypothetical protein
MHRIATRLIPAFAVLLIVASPATTASAQTDYRIRAWNFLDEFNYIERPKVAVSFGNPGIVQTSLGAATFVLEWTADGQPASPTLRLPQRARCVGESGRGFFCNALPNLFPVPGRDAAVGIEPAQYPQGFYVDNLDYETEYCFRVKANLLASPELEVAPWSSWACSRTPPAPPKPLTPPQPSVTILQAASGAGVIGGDSPVSALVEWKLAPSSADGSPPPRIASIAVQQADIAGTTWSTKKTFNAEENTGEAVIPFARNEEPTDSRRFLFRVCAGNISGNSCSAGAATSPFRKPDPLQTKTERAPFPTEVRAGGRVNAPAGSTPRPPLAICEAARVARERNSPAAPGLEAQCQAQGQATNLPALAAKGAAIAAADPVVARARASETNPEYLQGFDIATAIFGDPALGAEGNTATGPVSLRIRDSLSVPGRIGFNASLALHLSRNYRP